MVSQLLGISSNVRQRNNMPNEVKDSVATISTVAGGGLAVMGLNEWLTLALLITGIVLNVVRIVEIRKNKPKD